MTPPTLDFLRIRKPAASGVAVGYKTRFEVGGLECTFHDAGHILGAAMVECEGVLYTGDFNPTPGLVCGAAEAVKCETLVMESTYGDPRFDLPPKGLVLESIEAWTLRRLLSGPVALGAYPLGRAQELVALLNRAGQVPIVSADVGALSAVYNAHGATLAYAVAGSPKAQELAESNAVYVVPRTWLRKDAPFTRALRQRGGQAAYLSGWCHLYSYFGAYDIQAQFALSDHAGFRELVGFAEACAPKRVLTTHGAEATLAREIRKRLKIPAEPLAGSNGNKRGRSRGDG
jgi:Cft2 family RNA processing exonuclease